MKPYATMSKTALTRGVVVITLTAKVYSGKVITTYSSRIGFCGEFNKQILSEMAKMLKKAYEEQHRPGFKNADKVTFHTSVKTMECDVLLNGGR